MEAADLKSENQSHLSLTHRTIQHNTTLTDDAAFHTQTDVMMRSTEQSVRLQSAVCNSQKSDEQPSAALSLSLLCLCICLSVSASACLSLAGATRAIHHSRFLVSVVLRSTHFGLSSLSFPLPPFSLSSPSIISTHIPTIISSWVSLRHTIPLPLLCTVTLHLLYIESP